MVINLKLIKLEHFHEARIGNRGNGYQFLEHKYVDALERKDKQNDNP